MKSNINSLESKSFRYSFFTLALFMLFVFFSSFNPTDNKEEVFNKKTKAIITQWYELFLVLESKDINAYPPLSSQRIANLGVGGYITYKELDKYFLKHDHYALYVLNDIYCYQLQNYFNNFSSSELLKITHLRDRIRALFSEDHLQIDGNITLIENNIIDKVSLFFHNKNNCNNNTIQLIQSENNSWCAFNSENPVLPNWGQNKTIVVDKASIHVNKPYSNALTFGKAIHDDALAVYSLSMDLSKEDKWIAEFWSDDVRGLTFSPAGRWISITNQIVNNENIKTSELLELYFKLGLGLYDAGVLCWQYKYHYNLERPSSFINRNIDQNWKPLHDNPNFPAYPSGHAVFGAVSAAILEHQFGDNYHFTDKSHENRLEFKSSSRTFKNLNEMALENAYSRFVMGVHFKEDCEEGLKLGFKVAEQINKLHSDTLMNINNTLPVL